jgi:hypothetical protein
MLFQTKRQQPEKRNTGFWIAAFLCAEIKSKPIMKSDCLPGVYLFNC